VRVGEEAHTALGAVEHLENPVAGDQARALDGGIRDPVVGAFVAAHHEIVGVEPGPVARPWAVVSVVRGTGLRSAARPALTPAPYRRRPRTGRADRRGRSPSGGSPPCRAGSPAACGRPRRGRGGPRSCRAPPAPWSGTRPAPPPAPPPPAGAQEGGPGCGRSRGSPRTPRRAARGRAAPPRGR